MARIASTALLAALVFAAQARAAGPAPEIQRAAAKPQSNGTVHTVRTIPEACARLEGRFTGQAATPYALQPVRTSANCQPRAQLVDPAKARPSQATGWILNDVIRVPSAACGTQAAQVSVWRKPASKATPPRLDAQGRSRIYLQDANQKARAGQLNAVPQYAAVLAVEGTPCK